MTYLPQSFKNLVAKKKRLVVLFSHWLLHAYGIISISRLDKLGQDLPLLALVPGPALFYLLTARFTEPNRILSEGGNGHWCHFLCRRFTSLRLTLETFNLMKPLARTPKSHSHCSWYSILLVCIFCVLNIKQLVCEFPESPEVMLAIFTWQTLLCQK